jgi:CTP:molybdopterin cytidylyltransferase MocA
MKTPKMLLPFRGKTMIGTVIDNIKSAGIENIIVVVGAVKDEIIKITGKLSVVHCYNENFREGMLTSVKTGFDNLPDSCDAVLVFPGDQPLIKSESIIKVVDEYFRSRRGIIIPSYEGKRGHPILIDIKYRDEVLKLDNRDGLRALQGKFASDVSEIAVDDPGILKDFDTPEEYNDELHRNDQAN